jgi:hypothetical protein
MVIFRITLANDGITAGYKRLTAGGKTSQLLIMGILFISVAKGQKFQPQNTKRGREKKIVRGRENLGPNFW